MPAPPTPPRLTAVVPTIGVRGNPVLVVLAKRTYDLLPVGPPTNAEHPRPLTPTDTHFDDEFEGCVEHEADLLAPFKPVTDVVVVGQAHAPGGKPTTQCDVVAEVASQRKIV